MVEWSKKKRNEEVIFDLRNERQKANTKLNRMGYTFRRYCDIWKDRPRIIASKKENADNWKASVQYIKKVEQILFIRPSSEQDKFIELCFYDGKK